MQAQRIVMARRPVGAPVADDFRLETFSPSAPRDGEMLLQTLWLSLDPYMRGRMSEGKSYAKSLEIGDVITGGTVCRVIESKNGKFSAGDLVLAMTGWQTHAVSDGAGVMKLDPAMPHPSYALGVMGMPGMTAYVGLLDIGQPKEGETVAVAAATGPVGATVVQIAKLKGCHTIAIAGGSEKVAFARDVLKADMALDHRDPDFAAKLRAAASKGIDVYFENVGGDVQAAVLPLLNDFARMPVCGLIAWYNATQAPPGPDRVPGLMRMILTKRLHIQGFIVSDRGARYRDFQRDMGAWLQAGQVTTREDIVDGIEKAPAAFMGLLEGRNFGKLLVRVAS